MTRPRYDVRPWPGQRFAVFDNVACDRVEVYGLAGMAVDEAARLNGEEATA